MPDNKIGQVLSSAPDSIQIEISDLKIFEENKERLQIGRYLRIAEGNNDFVIGLIKNIKGTNTIKCSGSANFGHFLTDTLGRSLRGSPTCAAQASCA